MNHVNRNSLRISKNLLGIALCDGSIKAILRQLRGPKMAISDVQVKGSWIEVFDSNGRRISTMSSSGKSLGGFSSDFFVVVSGSWIETYDEKCHRIATMSSSGKEVRGAAGGNFTVKNGSWIETYDKNCKRINTRSV
jgi:hypothetical protein